MKKIAVVFVSMMLILASSCFAQTAKQKNKAFKKFMESRGYSCVTRMTNAFTKDTVVITGKTYQFESGRTLVQTADGFAFLGAYQEEYLRVKRITRKLKSSIVNQIYKEVTEGSFDQVRVVKN